MKGYSFIIFRTQVEARKAFFDMKQALAHKYNKCVINELCIETPTEEVFFISEHTISRLRGCRPSRIAVSNRVKHEIIDEHIRPLMCEITKFDYEVTKVFQNGNLLK